MTGLTIAAIVVGLLGLSVTVSLIFAAMASMVDSQIPGEHVEAIGHRVVPWVALGCAALVAGLLILDRMAAV